MSFDADVVKAGRGRVIRVDVSLDNFATIAHRYSDKAGVLDTANQYDNRVLELGAIRRALGQQRIAASSTTTLKLDNADGALDWLCGRESVADAAAARFRIYVAIYDPAASTLVFTSKMLGEFVLSSWPSNDNRAVMLSLADDFMGKLGSGLLLPTILDWQAVGTTANNPFKNSVGMPSSIGLNTPIQLAFGEDALLAFPHLIPWRNNAVGDAYYDKIIVPLYCTTDLTAVSQDLITQVIVENFAPPAFDSQGQPLEGAEVVRLENLQRFYYDSGQISAGTTPYENWTVEKSPTISKGGLDFQIVYLVVRTDMGAQKFQNIHALLPISDPPMSVEEQIAELEAIYGSHAYERGYPEEAVEEAGVAYRCVAARVSKWYVKGLPFSQLTNPATLLPIAHAVDVMTDLVSQYSSATIETTSAARVKAGVPYAACSGVVQPWTERANNASFPPPPLSLRQVLTELAQSSDFDVFMNWSGELEFCSDVFDFTTATQGSTIIEIREEDISRTARAVPSNGERHAPFNRVYFEGGKPDPTTHEEVPFQGPFDLEAATIPTSARSIEATMRQGWRPFRQQVLDPWQWRSLDGVARDRVRFVMHMGGLRLELGHYFKLTWSRGTSIGGPYASAIFQCEALTYSPSDDSVEVEGIWRDDTQTERQYLLDDETLLVRTKNAGNSPLTMADSNASLSMATGTDNFTTMGVQPGDIVILRDTTQAADVFTRNKTLRVDVVSSSTAIACIGDLDFDFPGASTVAAADWSIVRGATTYPTAVSDPTNYPSGGDMYGKVTDSTGETSDAATGNRLISG